MIGVKTEFGDFSNGANYWIAGELLLGAEDLNSHSAAFKFVLSMT